MSAALEGLRVLDLTTGPAGGIATMILADFGADVVVIDPPGENPLKSIASAPMWRRGKHVITLDVHRDRDVLEDLLAAADIFVCNWRPSALARAGLEFEAIHPKHPHLIYCHISGFGNHGPLRDVPGYEHVVAAVVGRMNGFAGIVDRDGPVFSALQVGVHATAQYAVSGILAAVVARRDAGAGRLVETSLLQGLLPYEQGALIGRQFVERFGDIYAERGSAEPPMPSLYYHPAQAGDGRWVQFGNLLPHLFDNFLMVTGLLDVLADEDWNAAQMVLPPEKHEAFRDRMLLTIQSRPAADWIADCIENGGVVATTYQTTQEALSDPDIVANGHVIDRAGGGVQLGPVATLTETPASPGPDCVTEDPVADDGIVARWRATPKEKPTDRSIDLPLAGVKVVEIATIIAAPMGASLLADMGAEVIKVEQIGGDPYRGLGRGVGSARVNAGKRSICVDLKSDDGKAIVMALLKDADVMIHNYRPGVPERLGIGYEQVAAINPGIVYLQSNGYGPNGPGKLRPSTHPIPGAAMGGVMYQMGGRVPETLQDIEGLRRWTRRLMRANEVNPDPNTAMVVMSSALLGLAARLRTGRGQRILMDMFGANAYANHDDFLSYPGKPPRAMLDELGHGLGPMYRLYRCQGDSWVFLALVNPRDRARFTQVLAQHGIETPDLSGDDLHVSEALSALFMSRHADEWQSMMVDETLACVRADANLPALFWLEHEQARAMSLTSEVAHPAWGDYRRHGAGVTFDGTQPALMPPPVAGQHGGEILAELGYDDDQVRALFERGVVWRDQSE
ncbi:MAG: CoA transferase [Pseudomonadales bacterium]|nr:CoA transferase [Pseudomonadales bacterium]